MRQAITLRTLAIKTNHQTALILTEKTKTSISILGKRSENVSFELSLLNKLGNQELFLGRFFAVQLAANKFNSFIL